MESFLKTHKETHARDLEEKKRTSRMISDKEKFEQALFQRRQEQYEKLKKERDERLAEKKAKLKEEREKRQKERQKEFKDAEKPSKSKWLSQLLGVELGLQMVVLLLLFALFWYWNKNTSFFGGSTSAGTFNKGNNL